MPTCRRAAWLRATRVVIGLGLVLGASLMTAPTTSAAPPKFAVSEPRVFPGKQYIPEPVLRSNRSAFLRAARSVGATHVRHWANWHDLHSCNPNRMANLKLLLSGIQQARAAGLTPIVSFSPVAAGYGSPCPGQPPTGFNPSGKAYGNFVSFVARYVVRDPYRVRSFTTINEPDIPHFLCVMDTSKPVGGGRRVPVSIRFEADMPVGSYVRNGKLLAANCGFVRGARRARYLHANAVAAITAQLAAIGRPRSYATIAFGDTTGVGKHWFRWSLQDARKIDADVVSVHAYWKGLKGRDAVDEPVVSGCDPSTFPTTGTPGDLWGFRNYLGGGCVRLLRTMVDARNADGRAGILRGKPIWSTEGGLNPARQLANGSNAGAYLRSVVEGGASLVTWYHVLGPGDIGWDTSFTDASGNQSPSGASIRDWAQSAGLPVAVPGGWIPAGAPGLVPCADGVPRPLSQPCEMAPPPEPVPSVAPGSWIINQGSDVPPH